MTKKKGKSKSKAKAKKPVKAVKAVKPVKPIRGKTKPINKGKSKPISKGKSKPISKGKSKPISKGKSKPISKGKSKPISKKKIDRDLKNFLKDQGISEKEFRKQSRKIQRELKEEFKETRPSQGDSGEWYYPNTKSLQQDYKNTKVASYRHNSYDSALNWWQGVTGGAGYFVILRKRSRKTGREIFYVMDIDPNRRRKGTSKKVADYQSDRALKLEEKFRESEDI